MSEYPEDLGGNFPSDAHRRVVGHLREPGDPPIPLSVLFGRIEADEFCPIADEVELALVVNDLEQGVTLNAGTEDEAVFPDGLVEKIEGGLRMTEAGLDLLKAPVAGE